MDRSAFMSCGCSAAACDEAVACGVWLPGLPKCDGTHLKAEAFLLLFPLCGLQAGIG